MALLTIRQAGGADIPVLLDVIHGAFEELIGRLEPPSGAHAERVESLNALFERGEQAALAMDGDKPVGCVFFTRTGVEMYAHRLAVLPAARRAGVGSALMRYVENAATDQGCAYVRVGVRLALTQNIAFFERLGYTAIIQDCHAGYDTPTFAHMTRELGPQMLRVVEVVAYDPQWPRRFAEEATAVQAALGDAVLSIEHIGSTAVPGLSAKPIIDMMPLVRSVRAVDKRIGALAQTGYTPRGEFGLPGRRYFVKGPAHARLVHCHIYQAGDPEVERHLAFRDFLRAHPAALAAYAQLKQRLAQAHPTDIVAYMDGKDALVKQLEAEALRWRRNRA